MNVSEKAKPYSIPKREVWEAYKQVKANRGAAGVDEQSIADFEENLSGNLYRIWNRMSSGSYFPLPVRGVEIPKANGGTRLLGIPTVADRIAQMVVKRFLEPILEPHFHVDSYGYRPRKSAKDALGVARQRCWRYNWVVDLDIRAFFDTIDHALLMRAVRKHTTCAWVLLYIERWLKAPMQRTHENIIERERGTPQGGVISPLLANLFLHYAFDTWMKREHLDIPFERYADDAICHCRTEKQASELQAELAKRFSECGLELHPEKTKIVYCGDSNRTEKHPNTQFDFLGYGFRPRCVKSAQGNFFVSFSPAISRNAAREIRKAIREQRFYQRTDLEIEDIARWINPMLRGWLEYFGAFHRSALYVAFLRPLEEHIARWAMRKYRWLQGHRRRAREWVANLLRDRPLLFSHRRYWAGTVG